MRTPPNPHIARTLLTSYVIVVYGIRPQENFSETRTLSHIHSERNGPGYRAETGACRARRGPGSRRGRFGGLGRRSSPRRRPGIGAATAGAGGGRLLILRADPVPVAQERNPRQVSTGAHGLARTERPQAWAGARAMHTGRPGSGFSVSRLPPLWMNRSLLKTAGPPIIGRHLGRVRLQRGWRHWADAAISGDNSGRWGVSRRLSTRTPAGEPGRNRLGSGDLSRGSRSRPKRRRLPYRRLDPVGDAPHPAGGSLAAQNRRAGTSLARPVRIGPAYPPGSLTSTLRRIRRNTLFSQR